MILLRKLRTNEFIEKGYVNAGANFGDAASYIGLGEPFGFKSLLNKWAEWEEEYSKRGYRTVSLDKFIGLGGYGENIDNLIGLKREEGEDPVLLAEIYQEIYLGKIKPAVDLQKVVDGKIQSGVCVVPSTELK